MNSAMPAGTPAQAQDGVLRDARAGHRLRLTITTSGKPFRAPVGLEPTALFGGHYEVRRNSVYASQLNVLLAPATGFQESPRDYGACNAAC